MKKLHVVLSMMLVSLLVLTACNKAKSDNNSLLALLGLGGGGAQFVKQFGTSFTSGADLPLNKDYDVKAKYLYTAAEIGGSGLIRSIRLHLYNGTEGKVTCPNVTIKMGHTNLSALTTTFANNVETGQGSEINVLGNKTLSIPRSTDGNSHWFDIPLDTPFYYNGVDNLVVDFEIPNKCSGEITSYIVSSGNRVARSIATDTQTGVAEYDPDTAIVSNTLVLMQFVFAGGDNRVVVPFDWGAYVPFSNAYGANRLRIQALYPANIVNGSGEICGIGFHIGELTTAENTYTVTVRLGHTALSSLSDASQWDDNFNSGSPVTVANGAVFRVPAGVPVGATVWLPLTKAFKYNGTDNLLMEVYVTSPSGLIYISRGHGTLGVNTTIWGMATDTDPDVDGADTNIYDVKFRFKGGTADVIGSGNHDLYPPFHGSVTGQFQPLYIASELGLNGSIKSIGFRLQNDSVAESYGNITIVMGHSDLATLALGQAYLDNINDEKTVFTGTVEVPDGLKAGDWVDIPLVTPFECTPGKNLAIYVRHDAGASSIENFVQGENDSDKYPGRLLGTENQTLYEPGWVADILPSIRLGLK